MTRGQIILITDEAVYGAGEFNGDMYYDWYGKEVIEALKNVETYADYAKFVYDFNAQNFQYPEQLIYEIGRFDTEEDVEKVNQLFDMSKNYIENWFSDYLYIKNISSNKFDIVSDEDDFDITIQPGEICSLCFGNLSEDYSGNDNIKKSLKPQYIEIFEELGWHVVEYEEGNGFYIENWSRNGEDLVEEFNYKTPIVEQLKNIYDYFNVDEHAVMWYNEGKMDLQGLLDDARDIDEMYYQLWQKCLQLNK